MFFVISGFIMVVTTTGRPDGLGASLNFLRKRVLRIYPVYWVWTTVLLPLWGFQTGGSGTEPDAVLCHLILFPVACVE